MGENKVAQKICGGEEDTGRHGAKGMLSLFESVEDTS